MGDHYLNMLQSNKISREGTSELPTVRQGEDRKSRKSSNTKVGSRSYSLGAGTAELHAAAVNLATTRQETSTSMASNDSKLLEKPSMRRPEESVTIDKVMRSSITSKLKSFHNSSIQSHEQASFNKLLNPSLHVAKSNESVQLLSSA